MHDRTIAEVEALLDTDAATGLDEADARRRRDLHGANVLPGVSRRGLPRRLWDQLANPLVVVLLVAAAVTAVIGAVTDVVVIAGVVVVNIAVGLAQEWRAERALDALRAFAPARAVVERSGARHEVDAADIVPGDVVLLATGDRVPADLRLVRTAALRADESMLTGESAAVGKGTDVPVGSPGIAGRTDIAHAGTLVVHGSGAGIAVATGAGTELGRIEEMIREADDLTTPLTRRLGRFSVRLAVVIAALAAVTVVVGLLRGQPLAEILMAAVALAVGAIPEGLPAAVTVALAVGVHRMARRRAIVRRLPAAEVLGSATVICTDKTGTLTENRMVVQEVVAPAGEIPCLRAAVLCSDARAGADGAMAGDAVEVAIVCEADRAGADPAGTRAAWQRIAEIPFASERRFMATLDRHADGHRMVHVKGAVEALLDRARTAEGVRAQAATLAARGLRVLAVAQMPWGGGDVLHEDDLQEVEVLGLIAMRDPPREGVREAVAECSGAGMRVMMVTGDQRETAQAIAREVGIAGDDVLARVAPEDKLALVRRLQSEGEVVAMTGDGVNDAPALRQADLGIAMGGSGTDVAREASDIVLVDDDFGTIVTAVREGRRAFDNITRFILWTLPTNIAEGMVVLVAILAGVALPLTPAQILWVNLATAITLGLPLTVEAMEPGAMRRPPRAPGAALLPRALVRRMLVAGAGLVVAVFGLYWASLALGADEDAARTVAMNTLVAGEIAYLFTCRSLTGPVRAMGIASNRLLLAGVAVMVALQVAMTYAPPMNSLFGSTPVAGWTWAAAVVAGLAVAAAVMVDRRRSSPASGVELVE